jgi:phosphopantetheinyl transferase (holo-ACP synthase)
MSFSGEEAVLPMLWSCRTGADGAAVIRDLVVESRRVLPGSVEVRHERGVPEVRLGGSRIEVSMARSPGYVAACAAVDSSAGWLGIDVEAVEPFLASGTRASDFAQVALGPAELDWFRSAAGASETQRLLWLLRTWVRKEAVLKALHTGFDTARGGLEPHAVALTAPWETPVCHSHPGITVTDLISDAHGDAVVLAAAQNPAAARPLAR